MSIFASEAERQDFFPVARHQIFLGHGGVTALPRCAADAMIAHVHASCQNHQEFGEVLRDIDACRALCARTIGADKSEIALLGPTSLGLSLFANGLKWEAGDELVCYQDDYPSNVYPWTALREKGVVVRFVQPDRPGHITIADVEAAITDRTKLVALASCHFLTGWRIDINTIGQMLHSRGILFSVDGIQTIGAFPTPVEHVDFLSADAHKWMLGPMAIGIVYVAKRNFAICQPTLLGAWNVRSPNFLTQPDLSFPETAQRYEPGVLNATGMYGMYASLKMLEEVGSETVSRLILDVRDYLEAGLTQLGFEFLSPPASEPMRSGIVTARHAGVKGSELFSALEKGRITASLRMERNSGDWLRFSPHFYNTRAEMDRVLEVLSAAL